MELFTWLVGAVLLCGSSAQSYWMQSTQKHQPGPPVQPQLKNPVPEVPFDKCHVEENEKIHCGTPDVTPEQCEHINCCFDGYRCYYGNAVTVQCTRDGQFVVVVARGSTLPPIDVNALSLLETNDPQCAAVDSTSSFAIFQFPVTACGTTLKQEDEDYIVYENHMSSSYEVGLGPRGSITRDSHFELLFQCRYSGTSVEALILEVNPVPPPVSVAGAGLLRVELRLGNGQCLSKGCMEEVAAYSSFYSPSDFPITKALREPLYVEVRLVGRSDPNVVLNLQHCWATSTTDPQSHPQWDLLLNGCPYQDDGYQTVVVPVDASSGLEYPTHYKRFIFKMFAFVTPDTFMPLKDTVFIHCETSVCVPDGENFCQQQCHRQRRAAPSISTGQRVLVSSGPVILTGKAAASYYM